MNNLLYNHKTLSSPKHLAKTHTNPDSHLSNLSNLSRPNLSVDHGQRD
jgi:hypothetical protein